MRVTLMVNPPMEKIMEVRVAAIGILPRLSTERKLTVALREHVRTE